MFAKYLYLANEFTNLGAWCLVSEYAEECEGTATKKVDKKETKNWQNF